MPSKLSRSAAHRALCKSEKALRHQLETLLQEHRTAAMQHGLLVAVCDVLQHMRWLQQQGAGSLASCLPSELLTPTEASLLDQLAATQYTAIPWESPTDCLPTPGQTSKEQSGSSNDSRDRHDKAAANTAGSSRMDLCSSSGSDPMRLAPPGDWLHLLRHVLSLEPYPGAADTTLQELSAVYGSRVKEMGMLLSVLHHDMLHADMGQPHPQEALRALVVQHIHQVATLGGLQRGDLMVKFSLLNHTTGELAAEHNDTRFKYILQQLGLSDQQRQEVACGHTLFTRLLTPILQERQQLQQLQQQQQQHGADATQVELHPQGSTGASCSIAADRNGSSSTSTSSARHFSLHAVFGDMQQQKQQAARLATLLSKEYFLVMVTSTFVVGCLIVEQCSRMCVLCWPWTPHFAAVGRIIAEEQQQQQQQTGC